MPHPNTPEAIDLARKGDWTLLQRIFGWQYIAELRGAMKKDEDVFAYLLAAH